MPASSAVRVVAPLPRYVGVGGSVLLAVAGFLGGALPGADLRSTVGSILTTPRTALAVGLFVLGVGLLGWAWWRLSRYPLTVSQAVFTAVLWALPLLAAPPLASRDVYAYACQGAVYAAGRSPYAEGVAGLPCPWLDTVSIIWRETPAPYGPGFVLAAGAVAALAGGTLVVAIAGLRLVALVGVVLLAWRLPVLARVCGVDPGRATWLALGTPLVVLHVVSGAHNDGLMVGLVVWALAVAARPGTAAAAGRWGWRTLAVGALFGAAAAIKVTAVVVLPFAALLLARFYRGQAGGSARAAGVRAVVVSAVLACLSAVAVVTGVSLLGGLGWGWVNGLVSSGDSRQWTSLPTGVGFAVDYVVLPAGHTAVPVTRAIGLVVLAVVLMGMFFLTWRCSGWTLAGVPEDDAMNVVRGIVAAAGWAWGATVLLAPVFHPWYALWPLTLLAVAGVGNRVVFAGNIGLVFVVLPDGFNLARVTKLPGALAMVGVTGWLLGRGVRQLCRWRQRVSAAVVSSLIQDR